MPKFEIGGKIVTIQRALPKFPAAMRMVRVDGKEVGLVYSIRGGWGFRTVDGENHFVAKLSAVAKLAAEQDQGTVASDADGAQIGKTHDLEDLRKHIPPGPYCYLVVGSRVKDGRTTLLRKACPHFDASDHGVVYCRFLEQQTGKPYGSIIADQQGAYEKALTHYNCVEALEAATPGFILFDGCKECCENDQYEACADELDLESQRAVDEYARRYGFADFSELQTLVAIPPYETETDRANFDKWRSSDFTKTGLTSLIQPPP